MVRILETVQCIYCPTKFVKRSCNQKTCGSAECLRISRLERTRRMAQEAKVKKLCSQCFSNPRTEGVLCSPCAKKSRYRQMERYSELKNSGICIQCGKEDALKDATMCRSCADNFKVYSKKSVSKNGSKRRTITCVNCGEIKEHHANGLCQSCYDKSKKIL